MKMATSFDDLDNALEGGINEGSSVLIISDMMIDKAKFGMDILSGMLSKHADSGLYFVNNKLPDFIKKRMKNWSRIKGKLSLIDGFSYTAGKESREEFQVKMKTTDIDSYTRVLKNVISDAFSKKGKRRTAFLFDSLDSWIGSWKLMENFIKEFRKTGIKKSVLYYLIADVDLNSREIKKLEKMFDYVITLKTTEKGNTILKQISIVKPSIKINISFRG